MGKLKRLLATVLSVTMFVAIAPSVVHAEVTDTWKFDFGAKNQTALDGYISVTPDMNYTDNIVDGLQFGFLGITEESYQENGKYDGFSVVKGQWINLESGGEDSELADSDYITAPSKTEYLPEGASEFEGRYPVRFSMKVDRKTYYTVTVTIANASSTESADATLFSEKRHTIANNVNIPVDETRTFTFNVDVEDLCYKNKGVYEDDMLNIVVVGKNAAISSMIVEKHGTKAGKIDGVDATVNDGITVWCCTDSTGCDQGAGIPYFPLQNYAGVAQELSKYVSADIAISNQGEGGLATNDNAHLAQCFLKEGDYLYVEYGHNESSAESYKANLEKYYTKAHNAGAKLIVVTPVERHNAWNETDEVYESGFVTINAAAKAFVDEKIETGAEDIAFVDLNTKYIEWMNTEIVRINSINSNISKKAAIEFYFRSVENSKVDTTHINDAGADQAAYWFMQAAKDVYNNGKEATDGSNAKIQSDVVAGLVTSMKTTIGDSEDPLVPYSIPDDIIQAGAAPNLYWDTPVTNTVPYKYSVAVSDVTVTDGIVSSIKVRVQNDLDTYARAVITVKESDDTTHTYYSKSVIDNTADLAGTVKEFAEFTASDNKEAETVEVQIHEGARCSVQVYEADLSDWTVGETTYSRVYDVKELKQVHISNACVNTEGWNIRGGAAPSMTLVDEDHLNFVKSGSGSSVASLSLSPNIAGNLVNVKMKMRFNSGLVNLNIGTHGKSNYFSNHMTLLRIYNGNVTTVDDTVLPTTNDETSINIVNAGVWFDVDCIIDYDLGKVSMSVAGSDYVTIDVPELQSNIVEILPMSAIGFSGDSKASEGFDIDVKDISVLQIERGEQLPQKTLTVNVNDRVMGSVKINDVAVSTIELPQSSVSTCKAIPNDGYVFVNWTDNYGNELSTAETYVVARLFEDTTIKANFKSAYGEGYVVQRIDKFTDDFEGTTNIFGVTEQSQYRNDDNTVYTEIKYNSSIVPTGNLSTSIYGNVLSLGRGVANLTSVLDEAITLNENQTMTMTFDTFPAWSGKGPKPHTISVCGADGSELVSYTCDEGSGTITNVEIGGETIETFTGDTIVVINDGFRYADFSIPSGTGDRNNGEYGATKVTITIKGDGTATLTMLHDNTTYTATGEIKGDVTVKSLSIVKEDGSNSSYVERVSAVDNFKTMLVTEPTKYNLVFTAKDSETTAAITPTITLKDMYGDTVDATNPVYGHFTYTAELDGYYNVDGKINVLDKDESIELEMIPNTLNVIQCKDSDGNIIKTVKSTDVTVHYPVIIKDEADYYQTTESGYFKTFTTPSQVVANYSKLENCVYYAEAEDIIEGDALTSDSFSNGNAKCQNEATIQTDALPAGTYKFYVAGYAANNTHVYVTPPVGTKSDGVITRGKYGVAESIFTTDGGAFTVSSNYATTFQMDYIYVVKLPDVIDTPQIEIDYQNETITGFSADENYTINGSAITPSNGEIAIDSAWFNTTISIISIGDGVNSSDSIPQSLSIPPRPTLTADIFTLDTANEGFVVPTGYFYGNSAEVMTNIGDGSVVKVAPEGKLYVYQAATSTSFKSDTLEITAPTRKIIGTVEIDFAEEKVNTDVDMKYSTDDGTTWKSCTADMSVTVFDGWNGTSVKTIEFYIPSDATNYASEIRTLEIPQRPTVTGINVTQPSVIGGKGTISGITNAMEYSTDNGENWIAGDGNDITEITAGTTYKIRVKATEDNFKSEEYVVTITEFDPLAEAMPDVKISYVTERLVGFVDDTQYIITVGDGEPQTMHSDNGELAIDSTWFGKSISIVKKGNGETTTDSQPQILIINARPVLPSVIAVHVSKIGAADGKITGVDNTMEYSTDGIEWMEVEISEIADLEDGVYKIRIKATETSFVSEITEIRVDTECAKIIATYENGMLKTVVICEGLVSEAQPVDENANTKIFYWETIENMKPVRIE